ncbi:MAG: mechanosensitive ion channel family protein [Gemmatimonadales bacterium]|jgi:miniconductance mechanosensitive channel
MMTFAEPTQAADQADSGWLAAPLDWLATHQMAASLLASLLLAVVAYLVDRLTLWLLSRTVSRLVKRTSASWDDVLHQHRFFRRLAHLAPLLAIYYGIDLVPGLAPAFTQLVHSASLAVMVLIGVLAADALLSAGGELYARSELSRGRPIKGYVQGAKIILYLLGGILVVATLTGQSPLIMLSGFAAFSAVLLLVFRDTILSFVASSQIATYDMMRVGDWIEVPQYGADGDVIDIGLHTIKVQNWDKTITSIPTHKFLSDSFKNWRAMSESGGRRIKRALYIDMNSIRFLDDSDIERFKNFVLLEDYIEQKQRELEEYNASRIDEANDVANARRLTNIGTFRAYIVRYLRDHPKVHKGMTLMVRQRDPTPQGLPLEIYVFSSDTGWVAYEGIQSDIFDHIIAIVPEFGLRVFQTPSGSDVEAALEVWGSTG